MLSTTIGRLHSTGGIRWCLLHVVVCLGVCGSIPAAVAQEIDVIRGTTFQTGEPLPRPFDVVLPHTDGRDAGVVFLVSEELYSDWAPLMFVGDRVETLVDAGLTVFLVPHENSLSCSAAALAKDVQQAVDYIRRNAARFRIDPDRLGAVGEGVSGHLALLLATHSGGAEAGDGAEPESSDSPSIAADGLAAVVALYPAHLKRKRPQQEASGATVVEDESNDADRSRVPAVLSGVPRAGAILQIVDRSDDSSGGWQERSVHQSLRGAGITTEMIEIDAGPNAADGADAASRAEAEMLQWFETHFAR